MDCNDHVAQNFDSDLLTSFPFILDVICNLACERLLLLVLLKLHYYSALRHQCFCSFGMRELACDL